MLSFRTAGESHGQALIALVEGIPAHLSIDFDFIDHELKRRQSGYGRGGRMKIERDQVRFLSGVRHGKTIGSPIAMMVENRDWANWEEIMSVREISAEAATKRRVTRPRPGHTDLAGSLKYDHTDARNILERSSARETAARVAAGGLAKVFLKVFGIEVLSHTTAIGKARVPEDLIVSWQQLETIRDDEVVRCALPDIAREMVKEIETAQKDGDTVGGTFEVVARGVPVGLGSHTGWDTRLDGRLAQAVMCVNAVKAVEIGKGVRIAYTQGSQAHDEIAYDNQQRRFYHLTNRAGGVEGGITNGEEVRVVGYLKPISTLKKALRSVDMVTKEPFLAQYERSDTCTVPAAGVIGESMVALVLATAFLEKFGGDSVEETTRNYNAYLDQLRAY
ncbi:MAG: chorismate synthase [Acidobacteria bacterium 13_1_20CM_2_55_15]|nr:MAG: chorismate synthase [Acidobacteria bacterium 13_1_40CM_56_16]OLD22109.1 MAG: chorismate synthase [Acidobacteria bacterium 13_1_40CM_3_56_11]OLD71524.1 MAG: chorismate synthase [Acidobacteria bacterium 13_1_40CM_2_56_11]OLE89736.1 MAG: chorismate synthase [Acidobacteria bacterium 13_1_20CM_2_55_15]